MCAKPARWLRSLNCERAARIVDTGFLPVPDLVARLPSIFEHGWHEMLHAVLAGANAPTVAVVPWLSQQRYRPSERWRERFRCNALNYKRLSLGFEWQKIHHHQRCLALRSAP